MKLDRLRRRDSTPPTSAQEDVSMESDRLGYPKVGKCDKSICGEEAACKQLENNTYMCLCPLDSSPPTPNLKCPNRVTVPITPRRIHNIRPPSGGYGTTTPQPNITTTTTNTTTMNTTTHIPLVESSSELYPENAEFVLPAVAVSSVLIIVMFISALICKKKGLFCKDKPARKTEPPLTGEPLLAERYISNPQYSSGGPNMSEDRVSVVLIGKENLCVIEEIGEGCFGKVFKGELRLEDNIITVAIKVLKDNADRSAEDDFNREVSIMSSFRHKNILSLLGVVPKANACGASMVFEYMTYGDVARVLRSNAPNIRNHIPGLPPLDSQKLLYIALQIAEGMKYLASQRFVHRDLACRNCLVGDNLIVKIADFGMSRDVYTSDYYKMGAKRNVPIRWMSPESIEYLRFTLETDVWSYGVVLWEIYSLGKQPYFGHSNDGAVKLILNGFMLVPPKNCPTYISDLMKACWNRDPKKRIRFYEICEKLEYFRDNMLTEELSDTIRDEREVWQSSLSRGSASSGRGLPRPPATLPSILLCPSPLPLPTQEQLMDPEGYLLPSLPTQISEYITAIPD